MTESSIGRAAAGEIDRDCPCVNCGYNLRTCAVDAKCPECGTMVRATLRGYADRLAGEDRRWLRQVTNGALWLALAMLFPCGFIVVPLPETSRGAWLTADRQQLAIVLTPAVFAAAGCWLLGAAPRRGAEGGSDQPLTRWALRAAALAWFVPLLLIAGSVGASRGPQETFFLWAEIFARQDRYQPLISTLTWSGLVATLLAFRRLKHVAGRVPSQFLLSQCGVVGSQLPVLMVLTAFLDERGWEYTNQAFGYAMRAPLLVAGLPWMYAFNAKYLQQIAWDNLSVTPLSLLVTWALLTWTATLVLVVQFVLVMIRVRRADAALPAYCWARLESVAGGDAADGLE